MLVWRRSLGRSHRYKMFSVVVSWTNNKDPTSDEGIWLFGTEWEAQCSARGCPSLAEPFSTLGTDIKAASTPLKYSHIHRHKDRHARTHTSMPARTRTQPQTHTMREVCLSRTRREGRQQKQLSVDRNKKNNSWKGVCMRESARQRHSLRQNSSVCGGKICKGDATIWALSLSSWTQDREGQAGGERNWEPGKPSSTSHQTLAGWRGLSLSGIQVFAAVCGLYWAVNTRLEQTFLSKWAGTMNWRCLKRGNEFLCPKAQDLLKRHRQKRNTLESYSSQWGPDYP